MKRTPPVIDNIPGVAWKPRKNGWEARWQARTDLIAKGWRPRSFGIFVGEDHEFTDPHNILYIQHRANSFQDDMLAWARGGLPIAGAYDGTLGSLARNYSTDPDSPYPKKRFATRRYYDKLISQITKDHGALLVSEIKGRTVKRWHDTWAADGAKVAMGHALIKMLRTLVNFGATILEDEECKRLSATLKEMRFQMARPRSSFLTAEQASKIRAKAHEMGFPSLALAQAFQFDCMLRQKDVIGEWVPVTEPGLSDVISGNDKWLRGIRWEEIDENLVLRHVTSKRQKPVEVPLSMAPMVMEELAILGERPASGPIVVLERFGTPYTAAYFRTLWRKIATECGVPSTVRNMDSRAGAITEATDAGADLEHIRHAATHSDIQMTQRYSRGDAEKTANVLRIRAEHRKKTT